MAGDHNVAGFGFQRAAVGRQVDGPLIIDKKGHRQAIEPEFFFGLEVVGRGRIQLPLFFPIAGGRLVDVVDRHVYSRLNSGDELFRLIENSAVVEISDHQQTDRRHDEERKNNFKRPGFFFRHVMQNPFTNGERH